MASPCMRAGLATLAVVVATAAGARAQAVTLPALTSSPTGTPAPVAQSAAAATPTPNPLTVNGTFRSFYFTRQNASNNPGAQFDFTPGAKYALVDAHSGAVVAQRHRRSGEFDGPSLDPSPIDLSIPPLQSASPM